MSCSELKEKVDVNDGCVDMCTEEPSESDEQVHTSANTEHEMFAPRRKRLAAEKANNSIHSLLAKKPQSMTLTMPKTPDVMK